MTDQRDLQASLSEMHRKLHELQRELASLSQPPEHEPESEPEPEPAPPLAPASPAPATSPDAIDEAAMRVAELGRRIDNLVELRDELDRATRSLQEENRHSTSR